MVQGCVCSVVHSSEFSVIVTIDGPAGAGKSSIAKQIAQALGFEFLDTGALYRAATLASLQAGVDLEDPQTLADFVSQLEIRWQDPQVRVNGSDVSRQIRTPEVTASIKYLADEPRVRAQLSLIQQSIAHGRNMVTEGRDQGAEVFPEAECKIFLTATAEERARRRVLQLAEQGIEEDFQAVLAAQMKRDHEDESRPVGRLRIADGAVVVNSDGLTAQEVKQQIVDLVQQRQ